MGAGTLTWALLLLLGQAGGDVVYTNQLNHRLDMQFKRQRSEIREVRLFVSANQGKSWDLADTIVRDKDNREYFVFRAQGDGTYWLRAAWINYKGEQFPENPGSGPPDQKMVIDTVKPIMRTLDARRDGNDVVVSWELQEDHPDAGSFRLEYQAKDGGSGLWTAIQAPPGPAGTARFPAGGNQALQVRLMLRDQAGNQSLRIAEVPAVGGLAGAAFNPMGTSNSAPPPPLLELGGAKLTIPNSGNTSIPLPPGIPTGPPTPSTLPVQPVIAQVAPPPPPSNAPPAIAPPAVTPANVSPVAPPHEEKLQVIASSQWTPTPPPNAILPESPITPVGALEPKPAPQPAPTTKLMPPLQYINQPEFVVDYEVSKIGPSGVGSVELYRTRDDGHTWEKYAYDPVLDEAAARQTRRQRTVKFQDGERDGVYGFTLIVKNRANIGRRPPQNGELPELRVELDTTPPIAELFAPAPDSKHANLILRWRASDKNLTRVPITLEWAQAREGPWQPIGVELPNTGEHVWKLPERMPVEVFLRLRVRDVAGNETIIMTPNALPVDLNEPEGHLIRVSVPQRNP